MTHYHSYSKRERKNPLRENPLRVTSNEAIHQKGKGIQSHDPSQERIDSMASSTTISTTTLAMAKA